MTLLRITALHDSGNSVRVHVAGEVDMCTAAQLATAARQAITGHPHGILIDLSAVAFLDAAGITALLASRRAADEQGIRMRAVNPCGVVRRVLAITDVLNPLEGYGRP